MMNLPGLSRGGGTVRFKLRLTRTRSQTRDSEPDSPRRRPGSVWQAAAPGTPARRAAAQLVAANLPPGRVEMTQPQPSRQLRLLRVTSPDS